VGPVGLGYDNGLICLATAFTFNSLQLVIFVIESSILFAAWSMLINPIFVVSTARIISTKKNDVRIPGSLVLRRSVKTPIQKSGLNKKVA